MQYAKEIHPSNFIARPQTMPKWTVCLKGTYCDLSFTAKMLYPINILIYEINFTCFITVASSRSVLQMLIKVVLSFPASALGFLITV